MVRGASASWIVRQILTLVDKAMPESSSQSYFTKSPLLLKFHTGPEFLLFCLPFVVCVCSRAARHMPWGPDRCQDGGGPLGMCLLQEVAATPCHPIPGG